MKKIIKTTSIILTAAFIAQDIAWANSREYLSAVSGLFGELKEFLHRHTRVFNNAFERPAVNFSVVRDNQGGLCSGVKELNMAAALSEFIISGAQENMDNFITGKQRRFHIARLKILWRESARTALGLGSKYKRIASFIFLIASLSVLPWLWHPGKEGTPATIYPSSPFSKTIFNFIFITSAVIYTIRKLVSQVLNVRGVIGQSIGATVVMPANRLCQKYKNTVIARAKGPKQSFSPSEIASSLTSFAPRNDENGYFDTVCSRE